MEHMDEYVTSGQSTGNGHRNGEPQNETKIIDNKKIAHTLTDSNGTTSIFVHQIFWNGTIKI